MEAESDPLAALGEKLAVGRGTVEVLEQQLHLPVADARILELKPVIKDWLTAQFALSLT